MAWEATVQLRDESEDVGIVTCIWNSGEADEFSYSRSARMTTAEKVKLVAEAKAALAAHVEKVAREATLAGIMATALNA